MSTNAFDQHHHNICSRTHGKAEPFRSHSNSANPQFIGTSLRRIERRSTLRSSRAPNRGSSLRFSVGNTFTLCPAWTVTLDPAAIESVLLSPSGLGGCRGENLRPSSTSPLTPIDQGPFPTAVGSSAWRPYFNLKFSASTRHQIASRFG